MTTAEISVTATDFRAVRADLLAAGLAGRAFTSAFSAAVDGWLVEHFARSMNGDGHDGVALLAVGGYGRGELCPGSDLDLVLLHDARRSVAGVAESLWYPVWDAGFHLDHSVRTPKELLTMASKDLKVALGLLTGRAVAGDADLAARSLARLRDGWAARPKASLDRLEAAVRERWEASGDVAFLLEPDLKQSRGGLRDIESLAAAGVATPIALPALDDAAVTAAHESLLRARVALHAATGRRNDTLVREQQAAVASRLGLEDRDALMLEVSAAGRAVAWAAEDTWDRVESWRRGPARRGGRDTQLEPGIVRRDGEVALDPGASPELDPSLSFRVMAAAAGAGVPVARRTLARLAEAHGPHGRWTDSTRNALVSLLGYGTASVHLMETLDHIGVLARYLPEWHVVRDRPQRDAYHVYTVDRHLLEAAAGAAGLVRRVHRPDLLLVGALLHDIGKGSGPDHTAAGIELAGVIAPRMGFEPTDVRVLCDLVRDHLLLAETATRRDLDDPATVERVAARVETRERLDLLAALTEADARATGPAAWSAWKAELVAELVARTRRRLAGVAVTAPAAFPAVAHRELMADGVLRVQCEASTLTVVAPDRPGLLAVIAGTLMLHRLDIRRATAAGEGGMAVDVFELDTSRAVYPDWNRLERDLHEALENPSATEHRLDERARAGRASASPAGVPGTDVLFDNDATPRATVVEVRTADGPGVLYRIALVLSAAGLDIASATADTLGHDVVDTFYVRVAAGGGKLTDPESLEQLRAAIVEGIDLR